MLLLFVIFLKTTPITAITVSLDPRQDWIMEQWEKNYYISAIAGASNGSSLVVMSKGLLRAINIVRFPSIYGFSDGVET